MAREATRLEQPNATLVSSASMIRYGETKQIGKLDDRIERSRIACTCFGPRADVDLHRSFGGSSAKRIIRTTVPSADAPAALSCLELACIQSAAASISDDAKGNSRDTPWEARDKLC